MSGTKKYEKGLFGGQEGWGYNCSIYYYSPTGNVIKQRLATISEVKSYNPFDKSIALLGAAGWELVSVQHANMQPNYPANQSAYLSGEYIVAYFKRPVVAGRPVDEPKLVV